MIVRELNWMATMVTKKEDLHWINVAQNKGCGKFVAFTAKNLRDLQNVGDSFIALWTILTPEG
jgi:hypothetical protein